MMIPRRLKSLCAAVAMLPLAACIAAPTEQNLPEITFAHLPELAVQVAGIEIQQDWQPPLAAPNVDHLSPTNPATVMKRWAADRLAARGNSGVGRFIITDASLIEERLDVDEGVTGLFKEEQSDRYTLKLTGTLEIERRDLKGKGFATASITKSRTVSEDITLAGREKVWFELTESAMAEFNEVMERNASIHLGGLVVQQPQ